MAFGRCAQFDALRTARFAAFGFAVHAPTGHVWYNILDNYVFPSEPTRYLPKQPLLMRCKRLSPAMLPWVECAQLCHALCPYVTLWQSARLVCSLRSQSPCLQCSLGLDLPCLPCIVLCHSAVAILQFAFPASMQTKKSQSSIKG